MDGCRRPTRSAARQRGSPAPIPSSGNCPQGYRTALAERAEEPQPGTAPIALDCACHPGGPCHPDPRRSHQQRGYPHRSPYPKCPAAPDARTHQLRHRPPAQHGASMPTWLLVHRRTGGSRRDLALQQSVLIHAAKEGVRGAEAQQPGGLHRVPSPKFSTSYSYTRLQRGPLSRSFPGIPSPSVQAGSLPWERRTTTTGSRGASAALCRRGDPGELRGEPHRRGYRPPRRGRRRSRTSSWR